ncbi:M1 family metallopeptidase [Ureibacillus sp. MALMAid1270]|uniref:M1 family metallopeptidase n=1 Tax=Ureibacillus sp. MALMAid1270 TaxID=3411629 RepID=UPI003BA707FF
MKRSFLLFNFFILLIIILSSCKQDENSDSTDVKNALSPLEENSGSTDVETAFSPKGIPAGSNTTYNINLKMNSSEIFEVEANIDIVNDSKDTWNELVFYLIPNIFSEKAPQALTIQEIKMDGEKVKYTLNEDTLKIQLKSGLVSNGETSVEILYDFTIPEKGLRFTKNNGNFYLAQFYPMLATYRNHRWNKEEYRFQGETYHTDFSDFYVTYHLPEGYTLVSTSPNDSYPSSTQGTLQASQVKEFFIAILQNPSVIEKEVNDTTIRIFGFDQEKELIQEITELAADALTYFEKTIGLYPHDQLDIILDGMSMEYPGVVTAHSINDIALDPDPLKSTILHELAHQWFYGVISNDPYHEAWLDEGFAGFATGLYAYSRPNKTVPYENLYKMIERLKPLPVNLSLDEYDSSAYIYDKTNVMLWKLFEKRGGLEEAERFLKTYYDEYLFKEVNSQEFIKFTKNYFNLKDDSVFDEWLK